VTAKEIFEILVRENSAMLRAYLSMVVRDASLADDLWQETMLIAWQRLDSFDRKRPFGPWLRGIASKLVLARGRTDRRWVTFGEEESLEALSVQCERVQALRGDTLDAKLDALRACVEGLPEHEQQCIKMRYSDGLKPSEIATRANIALEAVKKRLSRAKQRLQDCLQGKLLKGTGGLQ
jgi:RNA polymerase sigma-70 factor (ECF subfamily)